MHVRNLVRRFFVFNLFTILTLSRYSRAEQGPYGTCEYSNNHVVTTTHALITFHCTLHNVSDPTPVYISYWESADLGNRSESRKVFAKDHDADFSIPLQKIKPCTAYNFVIMAVGQASKTYGFSSSCIAIVLGRPTATKISLKILPTTEVSIETIRYYADSSPTNMQISYDHLQLQKNRPSTFEITDLDSNTKYWYKVIYSINSTTNISLHETSLFSFQTQRPQNEYFEFVIIADSHFNDSEGYDEAMFQKTLDCITTDKLVLESKVDFMFDLGDTFMAEKLKLTEENLHIPYLNLFHYFSRMCSSVPLFLVQGNHDAELGWSFNDLEKYLNPAVVMRTRKLFYANPFPNDFYSGNEDEAYIDIISNDDTSDPGDLYHQDYFALEWGNALFICLQPFWYITNKPKHSFDGWDWTLGKEQYNWLYSTLASSDRGLKFVLVHNLVGGVWGHWTPTKGWGGGGGEEWVKYYEMGGYNENDTYGFADRRPDWLHGPINDIFKKFHVSTVFKGHDHFWHSAVYDGVTYTTLPKPSKDVSAKNAMAYEKGYASCDIDENLCYGVEGFVKVQVSPDTAHIQYLDSSGRELRSYGVDATVVPIEVHVSEDEHDRDVEIIQLEENKVEGSTMPETVEEEGEDVPETVEGKEPNDAEGGAMPEIIEGEEAVAPEKTEEEVATRIRRGRNKWQKENVREKSRVRRPSGTTREYESPP